MTKIAIAKFILCKKCTHRRWNFNKLLNLQSLGFSICYWFHFHGFGLFIYYLFCYAFNLSMQIFRVCISKKGGNEQQNFFWNFHFLNNLEFRNNPLECNHTLEFLICNLKSPVLGIFLNTTPPFCSKVHFLKDISNWTPPKVNFEN